MKPCGQSWSNSSLSAPAGSAQQQPLETARSWGHRLPLLMVASAHFHLLRQASVTGGASVHIREAKPSTPAPQLHP